MSMTPEERARLLILEDWHEHGEDDVCEACKHEQAIADAIRAAVQAEREALLSKDFAEWAKRVSGPGLDYAAIGALVKTYLEDRARTAQEEE